MPIFGLNNAMVPIISYNYGAGKPENVLAGVVGALLGCLLGVGCIVLLGQLGYVAALSGIVLACLLYTSLHVHPDGGDLQRGQIAAGVVEIAGDGSIADEIGRAHV